MVRSLTVWFSCLSIGLGWLSTGSHAAEPQMIDVWPGKPPAEVDGIGAEADTTKPTDGQIAGKRLMRIGNVTKPVLAVYRPDAAANTGTCVVIAPGGGYTILAWDLEGTEVADWLTSKGVTAIVLKYRVPRRPGTAGDTEPIQPLQDAQRAISIVRTRAAEWGVDPQRIGMLGFSAGGSLTARTLAGAAKRSYDAVDDADKASPRPDFGVLIYPAYLVQKDKPEIKPEFSNLKDHPPTFLAHAGDDPISPENSARYYLELRRAGVPAELHIFASGGHGYGLRKTEAPVTTWPERCEVWLKGRGLLTKKQ